MKSEDRLCQNCKKEFTIEPEDFGFYEKIGVPAPTFCPECRLVRRMTWRNERSLFKRNCAKTGKEIITMFHPDEDVVVYDRDAWWSDAWESTDYGMDYDFSKPFFTQFRELLSKVPLANLGNENCVGSPYGNHNADCKDCYLTYASYNNERTHYSFGATGMKDCFDNYIGLNYELSYSNVLSSALFKTHFSYDADELIESSFIKVSKNLQNCIGCVNLRHRIYCILNTQYTKEEYLKKKKELDFGSYKKLCEFRKIFDDFSINFPKRHVSIVKSVDSNGDMMINSKNAKNCFDIYGDVEDSKYLIHFLEAKDCYDIYGGGAGIELSYEGIDAGIQASKQLFSVLTHTCLDTNYTYMCFNSKNLFGCIGMRGKQYCILNKQYGKEEYFEMVEKIKKHMNEMPYVDKKGNSYGYGEFFPAEISPFSYNETIAQEYFTKTKDEIEKSGFKFRLAPKKEYKATIKSEELPDHIKDVPESILDEVISCPNNGDEKTQCTQAYRIIKAELDFLKNNNIALPRYCPNCRHYQRLRQRNPFKLWHAKCQCTGATSSNGKYKNTSTHTHGDSVCQNEFETSYAPDRSEIVYCEKCYQSEVY